MTSKLSLLFKKFTVPALFTIVGLVMIIIGVQSKQDSTYMVATILMFVAGILSFLYSSGRISSKLVTSLGIVALIGSGATMYLSSVEVYETMEHGRKYKLCLKKSILNLTDIRAAQKAYAEKHGKYAKTWEELIDFIKNGKVPFVQAEGVVPPRKITEQERNILYGDNRAIDNNMTEIEAYLLSKSKAVPEDLKDFKRDTVMVNFMTTKFETKSYKVSRLKQGLGKFYPDSLPYIPMGKGAKWNMEVADSVVMGDLIFPAIRVWGKLPLAEMKGTQAKELSFGKLTTNDTGGSWEE